MNKLTREIIKPFLNENIGLYGGGFKPPTKGHVNVILKALSTNPDLDKIFIVVGSGERDGITQKDSLRIWQIYSKYLSDKVVIVPSKSPLKWMKDYIEDNPSEVIKVFIGTREGNEEDEKDFNQRSEFFKKYSQNIDIKKVTTPEGISATKLRRLINNADSSEELKQYLPNFLSKEDLSTIFDIIGHNINEMSDNEIKYWALNADLFSTLSKDPSQYEKLSNKLTGDRRDALDYFKGMIDLGNLHETIKKEGGKWVVYSKDGSKKLGTHKTKKEAEDQLQAIHIKQKLNENATYSNFIDYKKQILELCKYMVRQGMNIKPLPKVIFKNADVENAKEFFGKTAYYDPQAKSITLFTEGRHPKDIVRSFAHEMIHHEQNLEGRLDNIGTTNTEEDDYLNEIEKEAYLKGNITFRNWSDSLYNVIHENQSPDLIPGGIAQNMKLIDIAEKHAGDFYSALDLMPRLALELEKGIRVEMEHTDNPAVAREIAKDHLAEDPKYYTKLASLDL